MWQIIRTCYAAQIPDKYNKKKNKIKKIKYDIEIRD